MNSSEKDQWKRLAMEQACSEGGGYECPSLSGDDSAFWRLLANSVDDGICLLDAENLTLFVNEHLATLLGYGAEKLIGQSPDAFISPRDASSWRSSFKHWPPDQRHHLDCHLRAKDGSEPWVRLSIRPLYGAKRLYHGALLTVMDLSELGRAHAALEESDRRLRLVLDQLPVAVWILDKNLRATMAAGAGIKTMGLTEPELLGHTAEELFGPNDRLVWSGWRALQGESFSYEGERFGREFQAHVQPLRDDSGQITGVLGIGLDITKLLHSQQALYAEREFAQVTLDSIGEGVISTDVDGCIKYINSAAEMLCKWNRAEAIGRPIEEVVTLLNEHTGEESNSSVHEALERREIVELPIERVLLRRDGSRRYVSDCTAPIHDGHGRLRGAVIVFRDVTEHRRLAAELSHQATHDSLTQLPNRALLRDRLGQILTYAQRHRARMALLFIDLDHFKHVNDTLGHEIGDRLLQAVARRLVAAVRQCDTVSREGGDEFVMLLSDIAHPEDAGEFAEKLMERLTAPYQIKSYDLRLSVTIGISIFPEDGSEVEALIRGADLAMYHAKQRGRNHFQYFAADMNRKAAERLFLEHSLRRAREQGEFALQYQPQFDVATGELLGAEALLRWKHPQQGAIPPERFIPVAEDSGMILGIGTWVLYEACHQARLWSERGFPSCSVAVNFSAVQLRQQNVVEVVEHALVASGLAPENLELELTESMVMHDMTQVAAKLSRLKALGVRLAIDDFGTGYSSLSHLKRLPVDRLKIDQSFVRDLRTDADDAVIVQSVIGLGHNLELRVIAEGVEDADALQFLSDHGCDSAQGYFLSPPLGSAAFQDLLVQGPYWPLPPGM